MEILGLVGFIFASFAFFVFILLLIAARNDTVSAKLTLTACLISCITYAISAAQIHYLFSLHYVLVAEQFKLLIWAIVIGFITHQSDSLRDFFLDKSTKKKIIVWLSISVFLWCIALFSALGGSYLFLLFLILNLLLLVMLEQLYRNADESGRWAIWPLVIGLACLSVFDFVIFAQATMVNNLDFSFWYSRGYIATFIVPFILVSIRRIKNGSVRVFVSRNIVFYSSMLLIAGVYLLLMSLAGYIINYLGGAWGSLASTAFLVLGAVVLVALLVTESLRRKVKVFIAKHFFANKYEYREEWLNLIEKIETTSAESYYQMATNIIKSKINVKQGAIVKRVSDTQFQIQHNDGIQTSVALNREFGKFATFCKSHCWIIDFTEYKAKPDLYQDLHLDTELCEQIELSLVVPIFIGKAFYGMFVFAKANEANYLNWEDRDLLFAMSKQLGNFISLHEANDKLAESKQFDAFNRMSAFLVHDLKNIQAQLALINVNAQKHRSNPDFIDDVFETVGSATQRLEKVLSQLRNKTIAQSESKLTSLEGLITKVVEQRNVDLPVVRFDCQSDADMSLDSETFVSVLNHLIQNAQEATNNDGHVQIQLQTKDDIVKIIIQDNGCGMTKEFIKKRLFKPFDTTKGNAGMGIGVYEAKQFVEGIAGVIDVTSEVGQGTTFTISLPINPIFE